MKFGEALIGARGQIAWILALTLSTAAIIRLEHLDLGTRKAAVEAAAKATDARLATEAAAALAEARSRLAASPTDAEAAASLLLALATAVEAGALDPAEARTQADLLWDKAAKAGPAWRPGIVAAALTFAR